jgi:hypothetical protein
MGQCSKKAIILVFLLWSSISLSQGRLNLRNLQGRWYAKYDSLEISIVFYKNTGDLVYLPTGKKHHFKYRIKDNSVIEIAIGQDNMSHVIRTLTKASLHLAPYPLRLDQESIDLLDQVEFKRYQ